MQTINCQKQVQIEFRGMNCPVTVYVSKDVAEQLEMAGERRTLPDGTVVFIQPAHSRSLRTEH